MGFAGDGAGRAEGNGSLGATLPWGVKRVKFQGPQYSQDHGRSAILALIDHLPVPVPVMPWSVFSAFRLPWWSSFSKLSGGL